MLTEMYSMLMTGRFFSFIATTLLFILGTASAEAHSVEAKTYVTEINQQSNTPDYISQAKVAVKKYYPQYEEYFKPIFDQISKLDKSLIDIINKNLDNAINKSKDELKTEKQVYTMVLMTIEKLDGKNTFCNDSSTAENEEEREDLEGTATILEKYIAKGFAEKGKEIEKWKELIERIEILNKKDVLTKEDTEELLDVTEELYKAIENTNYFNDKRNKFLFNEYYTRSKDIGRQPNETGKKIIKWLKDHQE